MLNRAVRNHINSQESLPFKANLRPIYTRKKNTYYGKKKSINTPNKIIFYNFHFVIKELDKETGLYYYGFRYLDPKTSRFMSTDPAMGEYVPLAPLGENEKRHNQNLPGVGGIFNYVNFHVYHYGGNNPIRYVDPDGRKITVQSHRAFLGDKFPKLSWRWHHLSIRITLDTNELIARFGDDPRFEHTDDNKHKFLTVGAERMNGKLVGKINRSSDVNWTKNEIHDLDMAERNEIDTIDNILEAFDDYNNDLKYKLFPNGKRTNRREHGYNSNSFISGILNSAGLEAPPIESNVPGYDFPIPIHPED